MVSLFLSTIQHFFPYLAVDKRANIHAGISWNLRKHYLCDNLIICMIVQLFLLNKFFNKSHLNDQPYAIISYYGVPVVDTADLDALYILIVMQRERERELYNLIELDALYKPELVV